jgi:hypothetical protein
MHELAFLLSSIIFAGGILVGVRCQEINLHGREQRLSDERRRVNAQICALQTRHEVNKLIS